MRVTRGFGKRGRCPCRGKSVTFRVAGYTKCSYTSVTGRRAQQRRTSFGRRKCEPDLRAAGNRSSSDLVGRALRLSTIGDLPSRSPRASSHLDRSYLLFVRYRFVRATARFCVTLKGSSRGRCGAGREGPYERGNCGRSALDELRRKETRRRNEAGRARYFIFAEPSHRVRRSNLRRRRPRGHPGIRSRRTK